MSLEVRDGGGLPDEQNPSEAMEYQQEMSKRDSGVADVEPRYFCE